MFKISKQSFQQTTYIFFDGCWSNSAWVWILSKITLPKFVSLHFFHTVTAYSYIFIWSDNSKRSRNSSHPENTKAIHSTLKIFKTKTKSVESWKFSESSDNNKITRNSASILTMFKEIHSILEFPSTSLQS
jgi:hypothetical protein